MSTISSTERAAGLSEHRFVRVGVPHHVASELMRNGDAEEAIGVRDLAEVITVAWGAVLVAGTVIGIADGGISLTQLAREFIRSRATGGDSEITLRKGRRMVSASLESDPELAAAQFERLFREISGAAGEER